jgi:hypothetical protein
MIFLTWEDGKIAVMEVMEMIITVMAIMKMITMTVGKEIVIANIRMTGVPGVKISGVHSFRAENAGQNLRLDSNFARNAGYRQRHRISAYHAVSMFCRRQNSARHAEQRSRCEGMKRIDGRSQNRGTTISISEK